MCPSRCSLVRIPPKRNNGWVFKKVSTLGLFQVLGPGSGRPEVVLKIWSWKNIPLEQVPTLFLLAAAAAATSFLASQDDFSLSLSLSLSLSGEHTQTHARTPTLTPN